MDQVKPAASVTLHPTFLIHKDNLIRLPLSIAVRPIPVRNLPVQPNKVITLVFKIREPLSQSFLIKDLDSSASIASTTRNNLIFDKVENLG
jgi:hypothetical protein